MYDKTIIVHVYFTHRVLPPLKKCVKKINACNVKKENLFERSELFSFSVMQ